MSSSSKRKFTPKKRTAISGGPKSDSSNGLTRNGSSYAQRVVKELCHRCRDIFITEVFSELAKNLALDRFFEKIRIVETPAALR